MIFVDVKYTNKKKDGTTQTKESDYYTHIVEVKHLTCLFKYGLIHLMCIPSLIFREY